MRVLIADDSKPITMILQKVLNKAGITDVDTVLDGEEACALCQQLRYDLDLLDYHMPGMSGLDIIKLNHDKFKEQSTSVILITANADRELVLTLKQNGLRITDILSKPIDFTRLQNNVNNILSSRGVDIFINAPTKLDYAIIAKSDLHILVLKGTLEEVNSYDIQPIMHKLEQHIQSFRVVILDVSRMKEITLFVSEVLVTLGMWISLRDKRCYLSCDNKVHKAKLAIYNVFDYIPEWLGVD